MAEHARRDMAKGGVRPRLPVEAHPQLPVVERHEAVAVAVDGAYQLVDGRGRHLEPQPPKGLCELGHAEYAVAVGVEDAECVDKVEAT